MNLTTRHESAFKPLVVVTPVSVPTSFTDSSLVDGTYTNYVNRIFTASQQQQFVSAPFCEIDNLTPSRLDLSEFPVVKMVAEGTAGEGILRFREKDVSVQRRLWVGPTTQVGNQTITKELRNGTLLKYFHDLVIAKASQSGKSDEFYCRKSDNLPVPVHVGTTHTTVKPNPNCWVAGGWDFTGVPIWCSAGAAPNAGGGSQHGGVLITPQHLAEAEHFKGEVGTVWRWMLTDGTLVERHSIGVNRVESNTNFITDAWLKNLTGDMRIHTLNAPLPAGVKIYPIVGPWAYLVTSTGTPNGTYTWQTPLTVACPLVGIYLDQQRRAWFVGSYNSDCQIGSNAIASNTYNGSALSVGSASVGFSGLSPSANGAFVDQINATGRHRLGISGDSGSASFVPLSATELALVTCWTSPASGPTYEPPRCNALIASADADAIARGNLSTPTGLTVTVAPDPTL